MGKDRSRLLKKLVEQRDLFQIFSLVYTAREAADARHREIGGEEMACLAQLIRSRLFTRREFEDLVHALPSRLPSHFTQELTFDLSRDYLPSAAVGSDPSWLVVGNGKRPFRHVTYYHGRSFVKVLLRAAGADVATLTSLRKEVFGKYGTELHVTGVSIPVPERLETMLVRTMGVLVEDGIYRDTRWPEEVLIRVFKYPEPTLDLATSDFVGTNFYQYKMAREYLGSQANPIGLVRVREQDEQFFGFGGDVPDPKNSYSRTTTSMRVNCISCHSELFYGVNTIFSFERNPALESGLDENEIWSERVRGDYELHTGEFLELSKWLSPSQDNH